MAVFEVHQAATSDTIYALASAPIAAERGVFRISGPRAFEVAAALAQLSFDKERRVVDVDLHLPGKWASHVVLPARVLFFRGPKSYTGEDVVEVHTMVSPSIVELVEEVFESMGLRAAGAGEFTRRAFENGKLALDQAEAVLALIRAEDDDAIARATRRLRSGNDDEADAWRSELVDILALLESGLDFEEAETGSVEVELWLPGLLRIAARIEDFVGEARPRSRAGLPSFVLVGPPNAGKTSLWNALRCMTADADRSDIADKVASVDDGLVSPLAGTTRDVRWARLSSIRLGDAPGRDAPGRDASSTDDDEGAILRHELQEADGYILVVPVTRVASLGEPRDALGPPALCVVSQRDLDPSAEIPESAIACSAKTGQGLEAVLDALQRLGARPHSRLGTALLEARARAALQCVLRAIEVRDLGDEVVVAELANAIASLAPSDAAAVPEELLDRIFASFCLGK